MKTKMSTTWQSKTMVKIYITIFLMVTITLSTYTFGSTDPSISFGLGTKYDNGIGTSVAINTSGNNIIEVHQSEGFDTLYYRTGTPQQTNVSWSASVQYDNGIQPSVTLNDSGLVVEVHKAQILNTLWYHVGQINDTRIDWGSSRNYGNGQFPSVAIDNAGWCVEVHKAQADFGLWYYVGQVSSGDKNINWGTGQNYGNGNLPRVAMNNSGVIVEVHKSKDSNTLWYYVGKVNKNNKTIDWGSSFNYDNGMQPSISVNDDNVVIEVHTNPQGTLCQRIGKISGNSINWMVPSASFDNGEAPSVACNSKMAIQTHQSFSTLWYSTSLITNLPTQPNWMQDNLSLLGTRNLRHICIPGSHDAGMSFRNGGTAFVADCNTLTQTVGILGQLQFGIRYFDLRPVISGGIYKTGHYGKIDIIDSWQGANGQTMQSIIDDVNAFTAVNNELIILDLSHDLNTDVSNCCYRPFNQDEWDRLIAQMKGLNNLFIVANPTNVDLTTITLNNFISGPHAAVIVVLEPDNGDIHLGDYAKQGFYTTQNFPIYNNYSNTNDVNAMAQDQINKMKQQKQKPVPDAYFLLSWTLTQDNNQATNCITANSIRELADTANSKLNDGILHACTDQCYPNILYIDNVKSSDIVATAMTINNMAK